MTSSPTFALDVARRGFVQLIDYEPATVQANLDLDASLLQKAEQSDESQGPQESLRFWESQEYCVVLGHSSREELDVRREAYGSAGIPVLRRISGGGTVLLGPGCLNFSLVLSLTRRPALQMVRNSTEVILATLARGLNISGVSCAGVSDLALQGRKFSGNAQRRGRRALLHQGTLLYAFDVSQVARYLCEPSRQPVYRERRSHQQFLCNIPIDPQKLCQNLARIWNAH